MPVYEFICEDCQKIFSIHIRYADYGKIPVRCSRCGSHKVTRKISRIRIAKSEESRLENLDSLSGSDDLDRLGENPKALGRMLRKMSGEMGEDLGDEMHEVVDRLEKGQSPQEIERILPDLGGGSEMEDL